MSTYHYGYQCYPDSTHNDGKYSAKYPNISDMTAPIIDYSAGYHVFGVEINATTMRWYVDDVNNTILSVVPPTQLDPTFQWNVSPYVPIGELFMILNTAVSTWGCAQPPPLNGWAQPAQMLVDWVKVWRWEPACP